VESISRIQMPRTAGRTSATEASRRLSGESRLVNGGLLSGVDISKLTVARAFPREARGLTANATAAGLRQEAGHMDVKQLVVLALQISILCTVFGFGLKAVPQDLLYLIRKPWLLLRSLLAVFVIMPVVAVALARSFEFRFTVEIALVALAISPVPPVLPRKEAKAGAHHSFGLELMAMLALLSIVVVPVSVEILQRLFERPVEMPPGAIAGVILKAALLPLAAGMIVRSVLPTLAERIEKPVRLVANVLLPLAAVALLAGNWQAIWAAVGDGSLFAMTVFVAVGLLVGHLMGGPDPEHSVVLALSSACRHPAIALSIASSNFPDERFAGTILLYVIVSAVVGMPYLAWHRRQVAASVSA
jgi:BASS family bile acid:Na+ symporter